MDRESAQRIAKKPLARQEFALSLVLASGFYLVATLGLGLNFGLKHSLFIFVPLSIVFILYCLTLFVRRFNDSGLPGSIFGIGALLAVSLVFVLGKIGVGLLLLAALFIIGCSVPSRSS